MTKKIELLPAILEEKFAGVKRKFQKSSDLVKMVQVDICDGDFVPSKTIGASASKKSFQKLKDLADKNKLKLEIDLMVNLDRNFQKWLEGLEGLESKRIIFHLGSTKKWDELFDFLKKSKLKKTEIGLAVQIKHQCKKDILSVFEKYPFDYIQFMGIEKIGFGGQELSPKVYRKIKKFRKLKKETPISVDGGVKIFNAEKLKEAGATRLVSGSGFFGDKDLKERLKEFLD